MTTHPDLKKLLIENILEQAKENTEYELEN